MVISYQAQRLKYKGDHNGRGTMHEMQETGRNKGRTGSNDEKRHESHQRQLPRLQHQSLPHPRKEINIIRGRVIK